MGRAVNLSLLGLYEWDNTLFNLLTIPTQLDKETLVKNLLAQTAELEVLYPNPVVLKNLIGVWSAKQLDVWNRLYATTQYDYNPIENYNRYETGSDSGSRTDTQSGTDSTTGTLTQGGMDTHADTSALGGTDTHTISNTQSGKDTYSDDIERGGSDTVEGEKTSGHWIAGFDSTPSGNDDGLVKQTRDEESATTETTYGSTEAKDGEVNYGKRENGTDALAYGKTETKSGNYAYGKTETKGGTMTYGKSVTSENDGEHELHAHGNIGVTTTQKLIREQREIDLFNLYDIIIEDFKMRFCILVY